MASGAKFAVNDILTSAGGVDLGVDDAVEFALESYPALDVQSCVYTVVAKSPGAPALTFSNGGVADPPTATVTTTMPSTVGHTYLIQCQVNGGKAVKVNGKDDYSINTVVRAVAIRTVNNLRKIVVGERVQYDSTDGWTAAIDEVIDAIDTLWPVGASSLMGISVSAPVTKTGPTNSPTIGISAATTSADGSMSSTDKAKLDGIGAGAAVVTVNVTAPITKSGTTSPTIGISTASGSAAGSMSSAHYTLLAGATPNATADKLALRGSSGEAAFAYIGPSLSGTLPGTGFIRYANTGGAVIMMDSVASTGTPISVLNLDGSDGIIIGSAEAVTVQIVGQDWQYVGPNGNAVIAASETSIAMGLGPSTAFSLDVGNIAIDAKSFAFDGGTAATGISPGDLIWQARNAFSGNTLQGGGFQWKAGAGGGGSYFGGGFHFDFGAGAPGSGYTGFMTWAETTDGEFLSLRHEAGNVASFLAPGEARFAVGDGFSVWDTGIKQQLFVDIDTALELEWLPLLRFGSGKSGDVIVPILTQMKLTGTAGADGPDMTVEAATGQDATGGGTANSKGGTLFLKGGGKGTGGGGTVGRYGDVRIGNGNGSESGAGNIYLGDGSTSAGSAQGVIVVHDSHAAPSTPTGGFIMYSSAGNVVFKQQNPQSYTISYGGSSGRVLNAYTTNTESSGYTGIDNAQGGTPYATVTDLNALRAAYETLRASYDNAIGVIASMLTDLKASGLIA